MRYSAAVTKLSACIAYNIMYLSRSRVDDCSAFPICLIVCLYVCSYSSGSFHLPLSVYATDTSRMCVKRLSMFMPGYRITRYSYKFFVNGLFLLYFFEFNGTLPLWPIWAGEMNDSGWTRNIGMVKTMWYDMNSTSSLSALSISHTERHISARQQKIRQIIHVIRRFRFSFTTRTLTHTNNGSFYLFV